MNEVLTPKMLWVKDKISKWCEFITLNSADMKYKHEKKSFKEAAHSADIFIGFAHDTIASLVIQFSEECGLEDLRKENTWAETGQQIIKKVHFKLCFSLEILNF